MKVIYIDSVLFFFVFFLSQKRPHKEELSDEWSYFLFAHRKFEKIYRRGLNEGSDRNYPKGTYRRPESTATEML